MTRRKWQAIHKPYRLLGMATMKRGYRYHWLCEKCGEKYYESVQ